MILIGLTGSLGTGKTTVCEMFERHGAVSIDADRIVGELQSPGSPMLKRMAQLLGDDILNAEGSLRREVVARIIFSDPQKLKILNKLLHPAVRRRERALIALFNDYPLVVLNVPLLIENRLHGFMDFVVVVSAEEQIVEKRLIENRGMTREQIQKRKKAQMPLNLKASIAHFIINNSGSLDKTARQVERLARHLKMSNLNSIHSYNEIKSIP